MLLYPIRGHLAWDIVSRRNHAPTFGKYGTVAYYYQSGFERPDEAGVMYHPVDTQEDAEYWLDYYSQETFVIYGQEEKEYLRSYFIPFVEGALPQ